MKEIFFYILIPFIFSACGSEKNQSSTLFFSEQSEGLIIESERNPKEALFSASAFLISRCIAHPACRTVGLEGGKTL